MAEKKVTDAPPRRGTLPNGRVYSLDKLEMSQTLGTGTFGRVRLVRDRQSSEWLALKIMNISEVIRLKQIEHVRNEKNILKKIQHPFIVNMRWASHDNRYLYMLLEFVVGGELFSYLRAAVRFTTAAAIFYTAEIVSALDYLHSLNIVYRDLKPENLLISRQGHIKITDFGFAKELGDSNRTWTLCGTPEYLAPEIIQSRGHGKGVDWWALGILIYEMLVGYPPFFDDSPFGIYEKILQCRVDYPRHLDPHAKDFIKKLLVSDRTRRMGNLKNGAEDVKRHRIFRGIDWQDVYDGKLKPPIRPQVEHEGYAGNFDTYPEEDLPHGKVVSAEDLKHFEDF